MFLLCLAYNFLFRIYLIYMIILWKDVGFMGLKNWFLLRLYLLVMHSVIDCYNVCIFTYMQTWKGKPFTVGGVLENMSVNCRALRELFKMSDGRNSYAGMPQSILKVHNKNDPGTFLDNYYGCVQMWEKEDMFLLSFMPTLPYKKAKHNILFHLKGGHNAKC